MVDALQNWYASQCDETWEHSCGIEITNIDNPGWKVRVSGSSGKQCFKMNVERNGEDWVVVRATGSEFSGYCGPGNLNELLLLVVEWLR